MQLYDSSREYPFRGCTVYCKDGQVSCPVAPELGCAPLQDAYGKTIGLRCAAPCSQLRRVCGPGGVGRAVLLTEDLPLAMFDRDGEGFLGYLTSAQFEGALERRARDLFDCEECLDGTVKKYRRAEEDYALWRFGSHHDSDCLRKDNQYLDVIHYDDDPRPSPSFYPPTDLNILPVDYRCNRCEVGLAAQGCGACSDQRSRLFTATFQLFGVDYEPQRPLQRFADRRWLSSETLPQAIKMERYPYVGEGPAVDLSVLYGVPYRFYTSTVDPFCPVRLWTRKQSRFSNEPTNWSVVCLYEQGKHNSLNAQGKERIWDCNVEDSGWVLVPDEESSPQGVVQRDERFYIAAYPHVRGRSAYLRWNPKAGNFDLVRRDSATLFSFPSAPVGRLDSGCIFQPT